MLAIDDLLKHLKEYEVDGLKLINKNTKEVKVFSSKKALHCEIFILYVRKK